MEAECRGSFLYKAVVLKRRGAHIMKIKCSWDCHIFIMVIADSASVLILKRCLDISNILRNYSMQHVNGWRIHSFSLSSWVWLYSKTKGNYCIQKNTGLNIGKYGKQISNVTVIRVIRKMPCYINILSEIFQCQPPNHWQKTHHQIKRHERKYLTPNVDFEMEQFHQHRSLYV